MSTFSMFLPTIAICRFKSGVIDASDKLGKMDTQLQEVEAVLDRQRSNSSSQHRRRGTSETHQEDSSSFIHDSMEIVL